MEYTPRAARRRRFAIVLALVALGVIGLRALLPLGIEWAIEREGSRALGAPVSLENVDLALLRGSASIEGLRLGGAGGPSSPTQPPIASWDRLEIRLDPLQLFSGRIHLPEVSLRGPSLWLERDAAGGIRVPLPASNGQDDEPTPEDAAGAAATDGEETGWPLSVDRLELRDVHVVLPGERNTGKLLDLALSELSLDDLTLEGERIGLGALEIQGPALRLQRRLVAGGAEEEAEARPESSAGTASPKPASGPRYRIEHLAIDAGLFTLQSNAADLDVRLRMSASDVRSQENERFPFELELGVGEGELRLEGQLGLAPPGFDGRLVWKDLPVPPLSVAASPGLASWVRSCRASGDLSLRAELSSAGDLDVSFSGKTSLADLSLADSDAEQIALGWKQLDVDVREATFSLGRDGAPPRVRIALDRVRLVEPRARFTRSAPQVAAGPGEAPRSEAGSGGEGPDLDVWLGQVEVSGGSAEWTDRTVSPFFRGALRDLTLGARAVRYPELSARDVRLSGLAPGDAGFSVRGELTKGTGTLSADVDRLALPPFNPYATAAGVRLGGGAASLTSEIEIEAKRSVARNELVLHGLEVTQHDETRFQSRVGVPFNLAIALLEDARGDIQLSIPVTLRQGVSVDLRSAVLDAFYAALRGAVLAPLKLVGAALNPGPAEAALDVAPLRAEPGGAEMEDPGRIRALAGLLASRPELGVVLHGRAVAADEPELAQQMLIEQIGSGEELPVLPEVGWVERRSIVRALEALSRGEPTELDADGRALLRRYVESVEVPPERLEALARARAERVRELLVAAEGVASGRIAVRAGVGSGPPRVAAELVPASRIGGLSVVW